MTNDSVIPGQGTVQEAAQFLEDLVTYITSNQFQLIDFDGVVTTWGDWCVPSTTRASCVCGAPMLLLALCRNPQRLNHDPAWSDTRGVNALQMLSMLGAALGAQSLLQPDPARTALLEAGVANLTGSWPTVDYAKNIINAKIQTPIDDNFSDDELTFFPYFSWLVAALNSNSTATAKVVPAALSSLARTFDIISPLRSDLWNTVYLSAVQKWFPGSSNDLLSQTTLNDVAWNLRTWPLELVSWPVRNSQRIVRGVSSSLLRFAPPLDLCCPRVQDFFFDPTLNREGQSSTEATKVFPANERTQFRWNADPYDLDGGDGYSECDAGAWLLPYWMARHEGFITAPVQ